MKIIPLILKIERFLEIFFEKILEYLVVIR